MKVVYYELENLLAFDYPDFVDAYVSYAEIEDSDGNVEVATEEELDEINEDRDLVYSFALKSFNHDIDDME